MEKHREKQKDFHMVWRSMREKGAPEKYVRIIQDMYDHTKTLVKTSVGPTNEFSIKVGLHQGSALSPYLFDLVMEVLTRKIKMESLAVFQGSQKFPIELNLRSQLV